MYVQTDKNKYHVGFELDRETGPRAITRCKIFLLEPDNSPALVGQGRTLQGKKDVFNSVTGCTYALKRALEDSCLQRPARILFWKEFNRCHRRDIVTCRKAFANIGSNFSEALHKLINVSKAFEDDARRVCAHRIVSKGSGLDWCAKHRVDCTPKVQCGVTSAESTPGYGGLHSFQKRAMKKMLAMSNPTGHGPVDFYERITVTTPLRVKPYSPTKKSHLLANPYAHHRHEYHDNPHEYHDGGTVDMPVLLRKLYGLGWVKLINDRTGETIWPRNRATKREQYARIYGMESDYSNLERRILRQAKGRQDKVVIMHTMRSHGEVLKQLTESRDKIKDLVTDNAKQESWLRGTWAVANERLGARMLAMSLNAAEQARDLDVKLLKRPGIMKVLDEYIVDTNKFVPLFKMGETVTYKGAAAKVYRIDGPLVTIHSCGKVHEVFDHELESRLRTHWLHRAGLVLRQAGQAVATWFRFNYPGDDSLRQLAATIPGRGLYKMIHDNYCDQCHGRADFLQGPRGGTSCSNVKCKYCGQRYWLDHATRIAKRI